MRLEQFEAIIETAKQKSMQKAANNLFTTPQNISKLIKDFEKEFNVQIFVRNRLGIFLTKDGENIVNELQKVMSTLSQLKLQYTKPDFAFQEENLAINQLHFLSVASESEVITNILEDLKKNYSLSNVVINIEGAMTIIDYYKLGADKLLQKYDFVFSNIMEANITYLKSTVMDIPTFLLSKSHLGIHINKENPLSQKHNLSIKELLNESLIIYLPEKQKKPLPLIAIENMGCVLKPKYIVKSETLCQNLIQKNMGYSIVPISKHFSQFENTTLIPLKENIYIYHVLQINPSIMQQPYYPKIQKIISKKYKNIHQLF